MYLVMEIQQTADDEVTYLVNAYKTQAEAESKYHTVLAYAAISEVPVHSAAILTPTGYTQKSQYYVHEKPVEPEEVVEVTDVESEVN